jgi:hypothetical protein
VTLHVVVLEKKISTFIKDSYRNISDMVTLHVVVLRKKISTLIKDELLHVKSPDMSEMFL